MLSYRVVKNVFDRCIAFTLLVITLPLFPVIALAIKINSKGSIFFLHTRVGLNGETLKVIKFRTMVTTQSESSLDLSLSNDTRITSIGRILRRFKIDELPQLWNVLCGEMSLVGPRPEVKKYLKLYPEGTRAVILSVKPGITGVSQLEFINEGSLLKEVEDIENFYCTEILPQKIALDFRYANNLNFKDDLKIILRTIRGLVRA